MSTTPEDDGAEDEQPLETIDVGDQPSDPSRQPFTLRERERRREFARQDIALILLLIFAVTAVWVLITALIGSELAWANTKEALQILLPVEASLLGSAVTFYFATSDAWRDR